VWLAESLCDGVTDALTLSVCELVGETLTVVVADGELDCVSVDEGVGDGEGDAVAAAEGDVDGVGVIVTESVLVADAERPTLWLEVGDTEGVVVALGVDEKDETTDGVSVTDAEEDPVPDPDGVGVVVAVTSGVPLCESETVGVKE